MANYEVPEPILNSPYTEPQEHWLIQEGEEPQKIAGRRKAFYYYLAPNAVNHAEAGAPSGTKVELTLVNLIRERVSAWRDQNYPGTTRVTAELLNWWRRAGREKPLFFAQVEAAETVIFLAEARSDFLQGIATAIPWDDPGEDRKAEGFAAFRRYACKMATGSGKTTVMGMLTAWSILNKQANRGDARYSDVVIIVCPNVTIRDRLRELLPEGGKASLYRTRDLVPEHLMPQLSQGKVLVTNWHAFEPRGAQTGGVGAKVVRTGQRVVTEETINLGPKNTTMRGSRYLTEATLRLQVANGLIRIREEIKDKEGNLRKVKVESEKFVESDAKWLERVLGRDVGGKKNILVLNDEAHHAYRIRKEADEDTDLLEEEDEDDEDFVKEATVWVDGLDRIHKDRGINLCLDFSATPYYLGRVGQDAGRPFPWVISDFGLVDAIESGLVKIPQLAVRDNTGADIPGYFNIWQWIMPKLSAAERGGTRASPKPETILKYAFTPIAMLASLWEQIFQEWSLGEEEKRPPVFILVCKNTQISKVVHEWLAEEKCPHGIPPLNVRGLKNEGGALYTIRVDTKVVNETDSGNSKDDEKRWMRFTLDTVGRLHWALDSQLRPLLPEGFEELARKLERPLHPPGRDVRCIVSVGMLTEGWDCNTVTHVVGLRPFMSQLLCEQVVGRGLRRASYKVGEDGKLREEVAKVFGVPFAIIPFKSNPQGPPPPQPKRFHVHALPNRAQLAITFPRVEGYTQAIRNHLTVDWEKLPTLHLDPSLTPSRVDMKGLHVSESGRQSLHGPGQSEEVTLDVYRSRSREQGAAFVLTKELTLRLKEQGRCEIPLPALFPRVLAIVQRYLNDKVETALGTEKKDVFLSPYFGQILELLSENIRPDTSLGESPEIPRYETHRGPGSTADVDLWTSKEVREVEHSHLNFIVADTARWEQSAAYQMDKHPRVVSFVKNAGLGMTIPYWHNGTMHEYIPDFLVRFKDIPDFTLILETKGFDPLRDLKVAAADRWVKAVNAEGSSGRWSYTIAEKMDAVTKALDLAGNQQPFPGTREIKEHDLVSLIAPLSAEDLEAGASGTIVHLYADGFACEVEFITTHGSKVVTLLLNQVKPTN